MYEAYVSAATKCLPCLSRLREVTLALRIRSIHEKVVLFLHSYKILIVFVINESILSALYLIGSNLQMYYKNHEMACLLTCLLRLIVGLTVQCLKL